MAQSRDLVRSRKARFELLEDRRVLSSVWSAETVDKHVSDVRAMYLKALGQDGRPRVRSVPPLAASSKNE